MHIYIPVDVSKKYIALENEIAYLKGLSLNTFEYIMYKNKWFCSN